MIVQFYPKGNRDITTIEIIHEDFNEFQNGLCVVELYMERLHGNGSTTYKPMGFSVCLKEDNDFIEIYREGTEQRASIKFNNEVRKNGH